MHTYLRNTFAWYHKWHEDWVHGPSHWAIFACAVVTVVALGVYAVQTGSPSIVETAQAQVAACSNRSPITSACSCNGATVSTGFCCYNKVYPANQKSIVHQTTQCGYTEVSPHFQGLQSNSHGNIYFTGGTQRKNNPPGTPTPYPASFADDRTNWARHYDVIINGNDQLYDLTKPINPNIQMTKYMTGNELDCVLENHTLCEKYDYMQARATADGINFEDLFLHFKKNTTITASGQTRVFPGWNPADDQGQCGGTANDGTNDRIVSCGQAASDANATARTRFFARVPFGYDEYWRNTSASQYYPQDWRWRVNGKNAKYQQYNAEYYADAVRSSNTGGRDYSGIFVDNMGRSPYGSKTDPVLENGNTHELVSVFNTYSNSSNYTNDWYDNHILPTLQAAKASLNAIGKKLYINAITAEYWYPNFLNGADAFVREWVIKAKSTNTTTVGRFLNDLWPQVQASRAQSKEQHFNFTMETSWDDGGSGGCFQGYTLDQEKMWSLGTYHLLRYPGLHFYPGWKTWTGYYFGAMATDLGDPVGDWFEWKTGLKDSADQGTRTHKIYRRNFAKGTVFVRFYEGPEGYCPTANFTATPATAAFDAADLTKDYRKVNVDGTLSSLPANVSLGTAQALVLVQAASGPSADTTAPTVTVSSPAAGATVSGTVTLAANALDNVGVVGVQFKVDGANVGAEDTTSGYAVSWNAASVSSGSHVITAVARDAAGNTTTSASVTVTVNNVPTDSTAPGQVIDLRLQ
ncbi:MAG: Ig-like domain-containing protein [Patescibacteria group bacterium]